VPIPSSTELTADHPLIKSLQKILDDLGESAGGVKGVAAARTLLKETLSKLKGMKLAENKRLDLALIDGMFPHHGKDGAVDHKKVKDALAKVGKAKLSPDLKTKMKAHLDDHAKAKENAKEETMEDTELRTLLGLKEDEDIKAALIGLKAQHVALSDHQAVVQERDALKLKETERDAEETVRVAMSEGKVVPAMKDWAINLCKSDKAAFEAYTAAAPKIVSFSEHGRSGDNSGSPANGEGDPIPETTVKVAATMGVTPERLADRRPLSVKLAEQARERETAAAGKK
jgi:hypothetical protein